MEGYTYGIGKQQVEKAHIGKPAVGQPRRVYTWGTLASHRGSAMRFSKSLRL